MASCSGYSEALTKRLSALLKRKDYLNIMEIVKIIV